MRNRRAMATYLTQVAQQATDRPRALAAGILAVAVRRKPTGSPLLEFVEEQVRRAAAGDGNTAAEIVYELGTMLRELHDYFPADPLELEEHDT